MASDSICATAEKALVDMVRRDECQQFTIQRNQHVSVYNARFNIKPSQLTH